MTRQLTTRLVCWTIFASLAVAMGMAGQTALGDDTKAPVRKAISKKVKTNRRLPKFYTKIVTDEQRKAIFEIQEQYQPKLDELQKQLNELKKERDEKIAAVLTPEQKKQLDEARAAAKDAKAKPKAGKSAEPKDEK